MASTAESVTASLTAIQKDYAEAKVSAADAIRDLKSIASGWSILKDPNNWDDPNNHEDLIDLVKGVDTYVSRIDDIARTISAIKYNPPNGFDPNFKMQDNYIWRGALSDSIKTELAAYLASDGIPTKEFQDAIFNTDIERKQQTLNDLYELADAKTGAKGFTYPNSMTTALKLDAQQKYQFDRENQSREIVKTVTEWAKQIYQFSIEKGIEFEKFHADFTFQYCTAFVSVYKDLVLAATTEFKARIEAATAPIQAYIEAAKLPLDLGKLNADIQKENIALFIESNKIKVEEGLGYLREVNQSYITEFAQRIGAYSKISDNLAQIVQAASRAGITIQK